MKLSINESERTTRRVQNKKHMTEAVDFGRLTEVKMVIGSWGSYNSNNDRALGSKWLDLSEYTDWEEIEDELREEGFDLEGIDEELFIQDIDGISGIGEHESPQVVFETLLGEDFQQLKSSSGQY